MSSSEPTTSAPPTGRRTGRTATRSDHGDRGPRTALPPTSAYAGVNHQSVKLNNRAVVFRAIHALGPIARVHLAQQTGLNPGTVSNIVDELIRAGLTSETGYQTPGRSGRRPIDLEVNPAARYAIGIDVARNALTAALVDLSGELRERIVEPAHGPWRAEVAAAAACRLVNRLLDTVDPTERSKVVGLGIGATPLGIGSGRYLTPPLFDTWDDFDLKGELEHRLRLPVYVDNNGNTSALAELWFGAGLGVQNFVVLTFGVGIATGLVLDGDLYRGDHDLAGEAAHIGINLDGPQCACGNSGCLEMYVSIPRILASVQAALATGEPHDAYENHHELTLPTVISALSDNDPLTLRVIHDTARHLAAGIVTLIHTLDPEVVLIGRELSTLRDALLEPLRAEVQRRTFPAARDTTRIEATALPDAPVIGAATLALREFFQTPLQPPTLQAATS